MERIDRLFSQFIISSKELFSIIERMKGDAVALRGTAYDQAVRWKTMLKTDRDGLLAFIKAADTRQNASFSVKLPGRED